MTENDCPICYESITQTTGCCVLSCSHSFHIKCLTQWTSDASTCPMCRHTLTEIELVPKPPEIEPRQSYFITGAPNQGHTSMFQDIRERLNIPQPEPERRFCIGNGVIISEFDITLLISFTDVSRSRAIQELRYSSGNVEEAMLMIRDSHRYIPSTPPPPRNPMEPTDDMLTAWALQRLFKYGTVINDTYEYGSLADAIHRTNVTRFSGYASSLWMNVDFIDSEVRERSLSV